MVYRLLSLALLVSLLCSTLLPQPQAQAQGATATQESTSDSSKYEPFPGSDPVFETQPAETTLAPGLQPPASADPADQPTDPALGVKAGVSYLDRQYRLGANDQISVQFFAVPELDQKDITIGPDGAISLPGLGRMRVAGLTLAELEASLLARYSTMLVDSRLAVNLVQQKPFMVYISGAVLNPGSFEFNTNPNRFASQIVGDRAFTLNRTSPILSNILVAAGGITYDADVEHIAIKNSITGETFEINILDLLVAGEPMDVYLSQGDIVTVPRLRSALAVDEATYKAFINSTMAQGNIPVRVYGYVANPGLVRLENTQTNTLHSAITQAGGYNGDFSFQPHRVLISRVDGQGQVVTKEVDPRKEDPVLMPNDIVYVPEKAIGKVVRTFSILSTIVQPFAIGANAYNSWATVFNPTRNFIE